MRSSDSWLLEWITGCYCNLFYFLSVCRELIVDSIGLIKPNAIMSVPVLFNKVVEKERGRGRRNLLVAISVCKAFISTKTNQCPIYLRIVACLHRSYHGVA